MTSSDWKDIGEGLIATLAYVGVAVVLLTLGFYVLDLLSPGRLSSVIMNDRNRNAARVASAGMLGLAIVIGTAVLTTNDDFTSKLGDVVCDPEDHPASYLIGASLLAAGIIVATCIS